MGELGGLDDAVDYQTAYIADIAKEADYGYNIDTSECFHVWLKHRQGDITTYRNQSFTSHFTGTKSTVFHTPFMEAFDHSMQNFVTPKQWNKFSDNKTHQRTVHVTLNGILNILLFNFQLYFNFIMENYIRKADYKRIDRLVETA